MSKKSSKMNQARRMAPAGSRTSSKAAATRPAVGRPSNGKPVGVTIGRTHHKELEPEANLQAVRIVGGVFALLCAAGVVVALVLRKVEMNPASIIEMVLVGIFVALGIFAALQPQVVTGWVRRLGKR